MNDFDIHIVRWNKMVEAFEDKSKLSIDREFSKYYEKIISKLECKTYGFDCNFTIMGRDIGKVIKEFRKHTIQEHFIDYPEGVLMKFIRNKK